MSSGGSLPDAVVAHENRLDRRLTMTMTALTVVAGLIGGLVGAGGAYLGVREQIRGQNHVVERQIEDSRETYFRDQRRAAYAKFLQMSTATWVGMQEVVEAAFKFHGSFGVQPSLDALERQMQQFEYALADVRLIGDDLVAQRANDVQMSYIRLQVWLGRRASAVSLKPDFVDDAYDRLMKVGQLTDGFVAAVRADIGADTPATPAIGRSLFRTDLHIAAAKRRPRGRSRTPRSDRPLGSPPVALSKDWRRHGISQPLTAQTSAKGSDIAAKYLGSSYRSLV